MSDDIGKGDVVVARSNLAVGCQWTAPGRGDYHIQAGQRAVVEAVRKARGTCSNCTCTDLSGLRLVEYPLVEYAMWCPCEWKKLGGSQADTVAQFSAALSATPKLLIPAKTPKKVTERA